MLKTDDSGEIEASRGMLRTAWDRTAAPPIRFTPQPPVAMVRALFGITIGTAMRPEIQTTVDEIKQALSLLRRHL